MFVMATIYAGNTSASVKIRNLSPKGALIEGAHLPAEGAQVSLRRGSLAVSGEVVWCSNGRAGLKFETLASVAHWLPGGDARVRQEQVDVALQEIKASKDVSSKATEPRPAGVTDLEISNVKELVEALAETLADDDEVVARYGAKLQTLDLAAQLLGKLASK